MTAFALPAGAEATAPPEWRGLHRDEVRLMAVRPDGTRSLRFHDLPELLAPRRPGRREHVGHAARPPPGPAGGRRGGAAALVDDARRRRLGGRAAPARQRRARPRRRTRRRLGLPGGVVLTLVAGYPDPASPSRLWRARATPTVSAVGYLQEHGAPIRYGYLADDVGLDAFQTVYATDPEAPRCPAPAGRSARRCWSR